MSTVKKLRFAALRRVSTEQQKKTGESLSTQTADIERAVAELGGAVVEWYGGAEHATPGHEKKEVNRMLHDAQKKPCRFDAVIVAHPDRWSRDNTASRAGLELFKEHGIKFFVGTTEYDLFNPDHELFLGISAVIGQFFAKNQNSKSIKNRIARAEKGIPTAGKEPHGRRFNRETGKWEVDREKQRKIQDAAKRYLAGEKVEDLATELKMNRANLHRVLMWQSGSKWKIKFRSKTLNIDKVVEMDVPPLLDDDTIRKIHKKSADNQTFLHGHIKNQYLFSRMISCAHCGYAMTPQTNKLTGRRYYRHAAKTRFKTCPGPKTKAWLPADKFEDKVMRELFAQFGNPTAVRKALEAATPNNEKIREAVKRRDQIIKELLPEAKASIQRVIGWIGKDSSKKEDATAQYDKLKEHEGKLEAELARLEDELTHVPSRETLVRVSKHAGQILQRVSPTAVARARLADHDYDAMTYEQKRDLCQTVFSGKTADGKRMGVWITWKDDGKKWRYYIEGHLFIVTKSALHSPGHPPR